MAVEGVAVPPLLLVTPVTMGTPHTNVGMTTTGPVAVTVAVLVARVTAVTVTLAVLVERVVPGVVAVTVAVLVARVMSGWLRP